MQWITTQLDPARLEPAHVLIVAVNLEPLALADSIVAANPRVVVLLSPPVSPPPELATALAERTVLALDVRGDVTLRLDGERLWVETERGRRKSSEEMKPRRRERREAQDADVASASRRSRLRG